MNGSGSDKTLGLNLRLEPVFTSEEKDLAGFVLPTKVVRDLKMNRAQLVPKIPAATLKALASGFGDKVYLNSNIFEVVAKEGMCYQVGHCRAIRGMSGGAARRVHNGVAAELVGIVVARLGPKSRLEISSLNKP